MNCKYSCISQLTLSLYLMTQCQLKLRHSVTSLAQTLDYIQGDRRRHPFDATLDQLTLKLAERKISDTYHGMIIHVTNWLKLATNFQSAFSGASVHTVH